MSMSPEDIDLRVSQLEGWELKDGMIVRQFQFKDHYETQAFTNALMWISHKTDHHPYLMVGYNGVKVSYTTHSEGGLTEKDFNAAAKVNALLAV